VSCDLKTASAMADAMWTKYMTEPEPMKRAHYGERYAYWAEVRDELRDEAI
jgi:hypothetical protein